ncbi:MAG TPA: hypothetical protein VF284_06170 [Rhodanobacteraceae bacterium]
MKPAALFRELKRRNVPRAAVLYIGAAWALAQGISQLSSPFNLANWVTRWFVVACAIGFPFWIAFAWFYAWTPEGFKREEEVDRTATLIRSTGRKLDFWIIGILAVAVVLLTTNTFVVHRDATSLATQAEVNSLAAALAKIPEQSVAVLPLVNEGGSTDRQYFSNGLSEELISDLTQISGLKVIGQYSSFKFRDSQDSTAQIGATLGAANLIRGSVFQQGNRIRIVVNLIRASDGASVWSHSYDEELRDVFAIQSKISRAVAAALKIKLMGKPIVSDDKPPSGNVEAYRLMLQGHDLVRHQTEAGFTQGIALLRQALKLDPDYAYAWGMLSASLVNEGQISLNGEARQRAYAQARIAADRQQALAPEAAATHFVRGYLLSNVDNDPVGALAEFKRAQALAPNDGTTMVFLAYGFATVGRLQPAAEMFRKAIATDPLRAAWYTGLASVLLAQHQLDAAAQASRKALALQPDFPGPWANLAITDILQGDPVAALRDAKLETDPTLGPWIRTMAQQVGADRREADASLRDYITKYGKTEPYFVADLYAVRKQPADMFEWLQRAWTQQDPAFFSLLYDPFPRTYLGDPRFAALCQRAGLPVAPSASDSSPAL